MPPQGEPYHIDWICSNSSDVHVASNKERVKWEAHKHNLTTASDPRYSGKEKKWLKGTSEDDRDEGKQILKAMMVEDSTAEECEVDSGEENAFPADLEADPTSHVADYHFDEDELDWIEKHHRYSGNFLRLYGLNPWENEDCEEGKAIVQGMMAGDSDEEDEEDDPFLADLEADPSSHLADYHFDEKELDWIEMHHRHSGNFLRMSGLKPWDDEDCKKAKAMVHTFLKT